MITDKNELVGLIIDALKQEPGQKAWGIARQVGADKKLVNSLLYQELNGQVRQDREYRWYLTETATAAEAAVGYESHTPVNSHIARVASYYLDVLAHDDSYSATVFAESRYEPEYLELPSFPPESLTELPPDQASELRSAITRLISRQSRPGNRTAPAIGYPVYAQFIRARSGWHGYLLKPLFIFDVDTEEAGVLRLVDAQFPILNREVIEVLSGVRGSALMEELLSLTHELGLSDPQAIPEIDELFLRLQQIRPEWPWKEDLNPDTTTGESPLAQVSEEGFYNRSLLLRTERSHFTKGLETELQSLRRAEDHQIADTALSRMLGLPGGGDNASAVQQPLLEVVPLNTEQRHAVNSAMYRPLTVITGPPGTGKSQVVTEIVVNAVWHNQRVLVASKNNKAVDVVEDRVNSFSAQPGLFRLGPKELSLRLAEYLSTVLSANVGEDDRRTRAVLKDQYEKQLSELAEISRLRDIVVTTRNEVDRLSRELEPARNELGADMFANAVHADPDLLEVHVRNALSAARRLRKELQPWVTRLFWGFTRDARLSAARVAMDGLNPHLQYVLKDEQLPEINEVVAPVLETRLEALGSRVGHIRRAQEYHTAVRKLMTLPTLEQLAQDELKVQSGLHRTAVKLWSAWLQLLPERIDGTARSVLSKYASVLKMLAGQDSNESGSGALYRQYYELSEKASPYLSAWAVTSLSAKGRIPFHAGAFDLVVIDEASQCDIASALPLLYRAKRAVIIGDPNQLRHISAVSEKLDRQLLMKHDLIEQPQLAYSVNSLYDFAAGGAGEGGVIALRDHHRSHNHIIQFSNERFYAGKLRVATKYDALTRISDEEPAVQWEHVRGTTIRPESGSANNREEAEHVVQQVTRILGTPGFDGTIGVVTPFRGQANLINELLNRQEISSSKVSGTELLVDTVHKFQGDERDVIIFSPVVSRDAADSALRFLELNTHLFNVAITRARSHLIFVGDRVLADKLASGHVLRQFSHYLNDLEDMADAGIDPMEEVPETAVYPTVARPELVSDWEREFYVRLRSADIKPLPQYPVDQYLLDFALLNGERKLAIEVDGEHFHRDWDGELVVRDRLRTMRLSELGWDVMRFWVYEIRDYHDDCVRRVKDWLKAED